MNDDSLVYDAEGLANAIGLTPATVRKYMNTAPEKLPPRLDLPYKWKALWSKQQVQEWLESHRSTT